MHAIELSEIQFSYSSKQTVLEDINIQVPKGSIYGFLGKNGAGKTTTLRIILGLLKVNKGTVKVLGESIKSSYPRYLSNIGPLIESPAVYGHLTAIDNLRVSCKYTGSSISRISEVLDQVNLAYAGKKKVKAFSTGMKQRLGVAIALLQDPEILILDEPTNGLDPNGIIEFRSILHRLQAEGKSIILSSHILSEVEKIADVIGILHQGKMVFEGSIRDMEALKSLEAELMISDIAKGTKLLGDAFNWRVENEIVLVGIQDREALASIIGLMVKNGIDVYKANPVSKGLEQMFLDVTEN